MVFSPLEIAVFDRKNGMKPMNFHQILEEKLSLYDEVNPDFYSGMVDSTCMEHLIYRGFSVPHTVKKTYPKSIFKAKIPSEKVEFSHYTPVHNLSKSQELALESFNEHCPPDLKLTRRFTTIELQKTFRSLAKILHPDHGGSTTSFRDFFLSYKILLDFLASIK